MKRQIEVFDYANHILSELKTGVLVTTQSGNKVNTMTISWGSLGIEWGKPIFTIYVRESRYTKLLLDETNEFSINIAMDEIDTNILRVAGTKSGKDICKIKELNLTTIEGEKIGVPALKELPLTLECKVIYKQKQDENAITTENKERFYPLDENGDYSGSNRDFHTVYFGEIVNAYIIE